MPQKTEVELRNLALEVSKNTRKPFDQIWLKETKTKTVTTECKGGFLNLTTIKKQETQYYEEKSKFPVDCWILDQYTETDVDSQFFNVYAYSYVLKANGELGIVRLKSEEIHYDGSIFYKCCCANIEEMTFLNLITFRFLLSG